MDDLIFNGPFKKIQLPDRCLNAEALVSEWHFDAVPSAKGIETTLGIRLEMQLVIVIDAKIFTPLRLVKGEILFGVIRRKPIHNTKRDPRLAVDNGQHFLEIVLVFIKIFQFH
jgi:hypothetical protein